MYVSEKYITEHSYNEGIISRVTSWFKKMVSSSKKPLTEVELGLLKKENETFDILYRKIHLRGIKCRRLAKRKHNPELEIINCGIKGLEELIDIISSVKTCKHSTRRPVITDCKREKKILINMCEKAIKGHIKKRENLEDKK